MTKDFSLGRDTLGVIFDEAVEGEIVFIELGWDVFTQQEVINSSANFLKAFK